MTKKEVPVTKKTDVIRKVVKGTLSQSCKWWTTNPKQINSLNNIEIRFLRTVQKKDKMKNTSFRRQLQIIPIEETIEQGQLRWLGHINRMEKDRLMKK